MMLHNHSQPQTPQRAPAYFQVPIGCRRIPPNSATARDQLLHEFLEKPVFLQCHRSRNSPICLACERLKPLPPCARKLSFTRSKDEAPWRQTTLQSPPVARDRFQKVQQGDHRSPFYPSRENGFAFSSNQNVQVCLESARYAVNTRINDSCTDNDKTPRQKDPHNGQCN